MGAYHSAFDRRWAYTASVRDGLASAVWLEAARAVTTTGKVRLTLGSAVGNPVLGSQAKDSCSIWKSSAPLTPRVQPCTAQRL